MSDARPIQRQVVRHLQRLLAPEIRTFADGVLAGDPTLEAVLPGLYSKLAGVASRVLTEGAPTTVADLRRAIPVPTTGRFTRLEPEVVREILRQRRTGASRRKIALALKKPTATVHAVLRREGDPAPAALIEREAALKERTISKLQSQLDEIRRKAG